MSRESKTARETRVSVEAGLLASLVQASPAVLYVCRVAADCGTIGVTQNVERVLGFTPDDFIADPSLWAVRIHPDDSAKVFEEMPRLFREGRQTLEYRFRCADGHYIRLRDHMQLERDEQGKPHRILGCWIEVYEPRDATFITAVASGSAKTTTATLTDGGQDAK